MEQFEQIPIDVLIYDILPRTPLSELMRLCRTNKYINNLCQNEQLWKQKLVYDFPHVDVPNTVSNGWKDFYFYIESGVYEHYPQAPSKPNNITWRQYYQLLLYSYIYPLIYRGSEIPYPGKKIGYIFIIPTLTTFKSLLLQINNLLINNNINIDDYYINFTDLFTSGAINGNFYSQISLDEFRTAIDTFDIEIKIRPPRQEYNILNAFRANPIPYDLHIIILPNYDRELFYAVDARFNYLQQNYHYEISHDQS